MERVRHAIAQISNTLTVDAYQFPNGEIRVGVTSASVLVGYSKNYLARLPKASKKKLKALQKEGFSEVTKTGFVQHTENRGSEVNTISVQDLVLWLVFEAKTGNKTALDLLGALSGESLEERIQYPFNIPQKTVGEKIESFDERLAKISRETAAAFSDEEWRDTSNPGAEFQPSAWEARMLSAKWQPQTFLQFRSDEEIEDFIEMKRVEFEEGS